MVKTYFEKDYEMARNSLIPKAEEFARGEMRERAIRGELPDSPSGRGAIWSQIFHAKMNDLAEKAGLLKRESMVVLRLDRDLDLRLTIEKGRTEGKKKIKVEILKRSA